MSEATLEEQYLLDAFFILSERYELVGVPHKIESARENEDFQLALVCLKKIMAEPHKYDLGTPVTFIEDLRNDGIMTALSREVVSRILGDMEYVVLDICESNVDINRTPTPNDIFEELFPHKQQPPSVRMGVQMLSGDVFPEVWK